ncbi:cobalamin ABC transporter substrate-binding protein [Geothrix limicola]|uniref:Cobalamin ABC transporter substrate-binding protein n=1 Tax=Geothrix limicola TaxID=2927978 RepID=A0ABQ5QH50_9BACT|nr:ABC transporter substrate-binding protein [Geothrix limicola]GLH73695.1 cobalamin ABC transporter substrate-binding protein [Geothrix limicola]
MSARLFRLITCLLLLALPLAAARPQTPTAARPQRVVSQAVGTDELLLALADPGQIAALSHISHDGRYSPVAEDAKRFPALRDSDAESILRFRPDLVLAASFTRPETLALLKRTGVRLVVLDRFDTLEDVYASLRILGRELGQEARAEALITHCRTRVEALATRLKGVKPVRVLSVGVYPITAGSGTTFQDLCEHAGAVNVAAEAGLKGHAPTPSEKLLVWNAEVLVASGDEGLRSRLGEIPHYRVLPAFKAGRIVTLPGPLMSSVSHHRIEAYEALAKALHPERFK